MTSTILFEDPHLIVLSKPSGLLSQGEVSGDDNLVDQLRAYLKRHYVGLVHRLDRNTSGLMVVAKRSKAAARLSEALRQGEIERRYLAWLVGNLTTPQTWEHRLHKNRETNLVTISKALEDPLTTLLVTPQSQQTTRYGILTLAEFTLQTGKSHQIRVQAAAEGYGLLGDTKYNPQGPKFPRLALHSYYLAFNHPMTGARLKWQVEIPQELRL